jgi:hypothetical protein
VNPAGIETMETASCTHKKTAKGDPKKNALNSVLLVVQSYAWSQSKKKAWCEEGCTLSLSLFLSLSHIARCKSTALLCLACSRALEGALTDAQYESFARAHNSFEDYTGRQPSGRYRKAPSGKNRIQLWICPKNARNHPDKRFFYWRISSSKLPKI